MKQDTSTAPVRAGAGAGAGSTSAARLADWLRAEVRRLGPGERLPSTRTLIRAHQLSPVTVARALATLAAEGLVVSRPGAGTFVAQPGARLLPPDLSWQAVALGARPIEAEGLSPLADPPDDETVISLASGYLDPSLMPVRALTSALSRAGLLLPDAWQRPPTAGLASLRSWFAASVGGGCGPRDVVITPGGQGAIAASFRAVAGPGEPLLVESPTYPGALAAARLAGIRVLPVPADGDGVIPELLAEAFARSGARGFYCQPAFHNPTGAVLAGPRRRQVLEIARAAGAFVIEDDACRWLSHGRPPPPPLLADDGDGRVIYLTSLTKAMSPSLRIGAVIARGPVAARLHASVVVADLFTPRPLQEAAIDLVTRPVFDSHLRLLAQQLGRRAAALARAVAAELPAVQFTLPAGGMHLWARLPDEADDTAVDDTELAAAARRAGVVVMAGRPFFPAEAPAPHVRLTFSGAAEADLQEGVRRLARAAPALRHTVGGVAVAGGAVWA